MNAKKASENVFEFARMKDAFVDNVVDILNASYHKSKYIEECKEELLKLKQETFQKTIAIIGRTGSGKSSLLNALLNQENFLPVSQASACTAVPVEISANFLNENYEAEVEFLMEADWEMELKLRKRCHEDFKPERLPYNSTLVSTYKPISDDQAEDFIEKISRYMSAVPKELSQLDDNDDDDELYDVNDCDFVKCVKIRIPNSDLCSCGITLVDLPGKGDTHAVRNRIASEYINKCNAIWIVSPIGRAISDDIQTSIDDEFLQKLLMESRYGTLSFICTKTDEIDVNNYIQERKLQKDLDVERLKKALKDVEKIISENEKRRKLLNKDPVNNASDLEECKRVNLVSVGQKYEYDQELKEICVKHRNDYSRTHLERILKSKLSRLIPDKQLTASQVPNVFCVSAKDYKESIDREDESLVDRTGISDLAMHEKSSINLRIEQYTEGIVRRLTERILMIVNSLSDPVNADRDIQITAKKLFLNQNDLLQKSIETIKKENMEEIRRRYQYLITAVNQGIQKSVTSVINIVENWQTNYKYNTYQATVKRDGEYNSRSKIGNFKIDFNHELCESFIDSILIQWMTLFDIPVDNINQQIITAVKDFHVQLRSKLSNAPFSIYDMKLPSYADSQIKSDVKDIDSFTRLREVKIYATIKHTVLEHMRDAYELCLNVESGKNRYEKMNSVIKDHVNAVANELFEAVGSKLRTEIELWIALVERKLSVCTDRLLRDIANTHKPIFEKVDSENDKISIGRCLLKAVPDLKVLYPSSMNCNDKELFLELIKKCELLSHTTVKIENTASCSFVQESNGLNFSTGDVLLSDVKVEVPNVCDVKLEPIEKRKAQEEFDQLGVHLIKITLGRKEKNPKEHADAGAANLNPSHHDNTSTASFSVKKSHINITDEIHTHSSPIRSPSNISPDESGDKTWPILTCAHTPGKVSQTNKLGKLPQTNKPVKLPQANTSQKEPGANTPEIVPQTNTPWKVPQANTPGSVPQTNTPGKVPQANTPGSVPQTNTLGSVPQTNTPGKVPQATTEGSVPQTNTLGSVPQTNTLEKVPQTNTLEKQPQTNTPGAVLQVNSPGKVPAANKPGNLSATNTSEKVPQTSTQGKLPQPNTSGNVPATNTSGKVLQTNSPRKVPPANTPVKVPQANTPLRSLQSTMPATNLQATTSVIDPHHKAPVVLTGSHTPLKTSVQSVRSRSASGDVQPSTTLDFVLRKSPNVQRIAQDMSIEPSTLDKKLPSTSAVINAHMSTPPKAKSQRSTAVLGSVFNSSTPIQTPSTSTDNKHEDSPIPMKCRKTSATSEIAETIVID